jgi:histidinol-phosphate aminotransferase
LKLQEFYDKTSSFNQYSSGLSIEKFAQKIGKPKKEIIKLDANENLFLEKEFIQAIISQANKESDSRLYPSVEFNEVCNSIALYLGVYENQLVMGASGDQIIDLMLDTISEGAELITATPTFSMYKSTAIKKQIKFKGVNLQEDYKLNADKLLSQTSSKTQMIILCSPNNPTGNQFEKTQVIKIINEFPGIVLVDEAYVEYAPYSLVKEASNQENLVILRTFSKAFGLAGMRMGYAITNVKLAQALNTIYQMPYPLSTVSLKSGKIILENIDKIKNSIDDTQLERNWLYSRLKKMNFKTFESNTNFLLFDAGQKCDEIYEKLLEKGVIIRKIGSIFGCAGGLRVTIAPYSLMESFVSKLEEVLK